MTYVVDRGATRSSWIRIAECLKREAAMRNFIITVALALSLSSCVGPYYDGDVGFYDDGGPDFFFGGWGGDWGGGGGHHHHHHHHHGGGHHGGHHGGGHHGGGHHH